MTDDEYEVQRKAEREAGLRYMREHAVDVPREPGETTDVFLERADCMMAGPPPEAPVDFALAEMRSIMANAASAQICNPDDDELQAAKDEMVSLLREHIKEEVAKGRDPRQVHREFMIAAARQFGMVPRRARIRRSQIVSSRSVRRSAPRARSRRSHRAASSRGSPSASSDGSDPPGEHSRVLAVRL